MKDYQNFSAQDFALDEYFQSWVLHPSESTNEFWESWCAQHPEKITEIEEAKGILNAFDLPEYTLSTKDVSTLWEKIQQENNSISTKESISLSKTNRWYWVSAAVLLFGAILLALIANKDQVEYRTEFGETKTILLPDSSTVILNANSSIVFNKDWDHQYSRKVWMEGEAYFSVVHKQDHEPFKVNTMNGVEIEVLGTKFNVYHRAVETKVLLSSGQILLSFPIHKKEKKILMKPGELVEYAKDKYNKRMVDPAIYSAWTHNKIILNKTSLQEMIQMAKDNYDLVIEVQSEKLLHQTVSGSMPVGDAESFVRQIAKAFQLKAIETNDHFLLIE